MTRSPSPSIVFEEGRPARFPSLEPLYASGGSLGIYFGNRIWSGAVIFDRNDIDEAAFLKELRQIISDNGLLMEYLSVTTVNRTRVVPIGGTIREVIERPVRWIQILRWQVPRAIVGTFLVLSLILTGAILAPFPLAVLLTVMYLVVNEILGVQRWTAVLAYPAVFVFVPLILYALARRTFVWGGRRYRWRGNFDVTALN